MRTGQLKCGGRIYSYRKAVGEMECMLPLISTRVISLEYGYAIKEIIKKIKKGGEREYLAETSERTGFPFFLAAVCPCGYVLEYALSVGHTWT